MSIPEVESVKIRSFNNRHSMLNYQLLMLSDKEGTLGLPATPAHLILVTQLN